jgi:hypothetical protein
VQARHPILLFFLRISLPRQFSGREQRLRGGAWFH